MAQASAGGDPGGGDVGTGGGAQFLRTSSVSAYSLLCHFGKECSRQFDFHEPLLSVFPSQPSPFYAQETQLPAFSVLGLQHEVT